MYIRYLAVFVLFTLTMRAATPLDAPLQDGGATTIECDIKGRAPKIGIYNNVKAEYTKSCTQTKGFHYKLQLPEDYSKHPDWKYPAMFIASPGGNARMGRMQQRLIRDQWIVVMLVESRNGKPNWLNNFIAAYDDVIKRVRVAKGAKFATGMSGGARCIGVYPVLRPGFRGLICQSAGFCYGFDQIDDSMIYSKYPRHVLVAGTFGTKDMNRSETWKFRCRFPRDTNWYAEVFEGGHSWAPVSTLERVMDWMEEQCFLAKPVRAGSTNMLGVGVKAESMGTDAYLWFFRATVKRANRGTNDCERYFQYKRLGAIARNGRLETNAWVKKTLVVVQQQMKKLEAKSEVQQLLRAEKDAENIEKAFNSFHQLLHRGDCAGNDGLLKRTAQGKLDSLRKKVEDYAGKYPDTIYAKKFSGRIGALNIEFSTPIK